jgi:hypothetical protein
MTRNRHRDAGEVESQLGRRLRREAARGRPAFSPALQMRVMEAVAGEGHGHRGPAAPWAVAVAAVGWALLGVGGGWWLVGRPGPTPGGQPSAALATAAVEPPPIDKLPLPEELGAQFLAGTAALAAEAVGLPRWNDLVDAGTAFAAAGDDWPGSVTP